jgi:hypothetical protein
MNALDRNNLAEQQQHEIVHEAMRREDGAIVCSRCGTAWAGPVPAHLAKPRRDVPSGLDGLAEDGLDVGSIENGFVVVNFIGEEAAVGPFRFRETAERERDEMLDADPDAGPGDIAVVPIFRPYAVPGVLLRATEAEEDRYHALMTKDPAQRTDEEEGFIETIGDLLVAELADEDA